MNFSAADLSSLTTLSPLLCACAAAFPFLVLCAAPAQQPQPPTKAQAQAPSKPAPEVEALLAKIDAARGAAKAPATIAIEGTYEVRFGDAKEPVATGAFREVFAGADRARHTSDMGEHGAMERGITGDLTWELDPMMGPKVHAGAQAIAVRRHFAMLRNASPRALYCGFVRAGTETIDGVACTVLKGTPTEGKADTWYVDPATGNVHRIDTVLPAPESADATWEMGDWHETKLGFGDWKQVGGAAFPHSRSLRMGPATVTFTVTKLAVGDAIDGKRFEPPAAVAAASKRTPAGKAVDADGKPVYSVVDREAQPVASIRVKCKPADISATLAVVLPEVMAHLIAAGAKMTGPPFSRYHAFGPDEIDLEAGMPVAKPVVEKGRVKNSELPAGKALSVLHVGPYEKLGDAHAALAAHAAKEKLKALGGPWEVYRTDPGMVPDPAKWQTQLFLPVSQ